jgi:hypothetical protein
VMPSLGSSSDGTADPTYVPRYAETGCLWSSTSAANSQPSVMGKAPAASDVAGCLGAPAAVASAAVVHVCYDS